MMDKFCGYCLLLLLSIVCVQCNAPVEPTVISLTAKIEGDLGARLDSTVTPYLEELRIRTDNPAGLAVGVTQGQKIIYARTFGFANLEKSIPADFNTRFHIASVSKPFAAVAMLKLVEQGLLELDDRVIDHLPDFKMKGEAYQDITIRHILSHTSGIPRHISSGDWDNPTYGEAALEKTLQDIAGFDLDFSPGSEYNYSNSGFDLLSNLVAEVSGSSFEDFVTANLLIPAGMTHSEYRKPRDSLPNNWAAAYSYGLRTTAWYPYPYSENYFPSSGLHATLPDMCHWGMLHVNGGKLNGKQVLDSSSYALLISPSFATPWGDSIGLSWFLQSYLDRPIIMHTGSDTGFEAMMYIYPADSISIVVMANRDFSRTGRMVNAVSEAIFATGMKDYTVSARYQFASAYQTGGLKKAAQQWEALRADTTDIYYTDNDDILTVGAVLENNQDWESAAEILNFYLTEINDRSTYAWRLLGNSQLNLGDTLAAVNCYRKTLDLNPAYEKGRVALEKLGFRE